MVGRAESFVEIGNPLRLQVARLAGDQGLSDTSGGAEFSHKGRALAYHIRAVPLRVVGSKLLDAGCPAVKHIVTPVGS